MVNVGDLTREQLKGIKVDCGLWEKPKEETLDFLAECHNVFTNRVFKEILERLVNTQVLFTVNEAENWEQVIFGRATINGISLVKDAFEAFDSLYKEKIKKEESFNTTETI